MAALVQTFQPQSSTTVMLQARPASTTGVMSGGQHHGQHPYGGHASQAPRSATYGSASSSGYRGSSAPVQPYAFTSTPNLSQSLSWQQHGAYRTSSSPAVPQAHGYDAGMTYRPVATGNSFNAAAFPNAYGASYGGSRDDSAIVTARNFSPTARPQSYLPSPPQQSYFTLNSNKASGERYRRPAAQSSLHARSQSTNLPSGAPMASPNQAYLANHRLSGSHLTNGRGLTATASMDDLQLYSRPPLIDQVRRRGSNTIETPDFSGLRKSSADAAEAKKQRASSPAHHSRDGSSESISSTRSSHSRPSSATNRNVPTPTGNPSLLGGEEMATKSDQHKSLNIPSRGSSSDIGAKRTLSPSPLSKPVTMEHEAADEFAASAAASVNLSSPAAKQLAALNQKGGKAKSKTSRLRRAFSFGSAAEFRKAAEDEERSEPAKLHKEPTAEEAYDAEQERIAQAQEAGGIGNSIYGGRFFGSTDNLSISSTASSASIMIRKMGRGMKKSTRSLVGLFRPKSIVGVPAAEALAPEASEATVSMITVEAETQRVNVTADPHASNGGTGFPRLERNSLDAAHIPEAVEERAISSHGEQTGGRRSIVGGEKERAEVLAAVKKGILKRSGSPSVRPVDASPDLVLPNIPAVADSPISSAPSTPNDEAHGHRRTGSIALGSEDYFMSALRLRQDSKSPPGTPQLKRSATFSPRIVFYDTWPSQEYDRRGEIATCNRLTPMLAQQIKEELNTFKMEMEVHENSKIYTHFF